MCVDELLTCLKPMVGLLHTQLFFKLKFLLRHLILSCQFRIQVLPPLLSLDQILDDHRCPQRLSPAPDTIKLISCPVRDQDGFLVGLSSPKVSFLALLFLWWASLFEVISDILCHSFCCVWVCFL